MCRRSLLAAVGVYLLAAGGAAGADGALRFDVASLKPSPDWDRIRRPPSPKSEGGPGSATPTRFTVRNTTLSMLVVRAWGIKLYQIEATDLDGGSYPDARTYDIDATMPEGVTKEQFGEMLRNLLIDRFALRVHREVKAGPIFELQVDKHGPKMIPNLEPPLAPEARPARIPANGRDGFPPMPSGYTGAFGRVVGGRTTLKYLRYSMSSLAADLSNRLGRAVVDRTRLDGNFDFVLQFESGNGTSGADRGAAPDLFKALQSQLGLKLVAATGAVETLVVDHVERVPKAN